MENNKIYEQMYSIINLNYSGKFQQYIAVAFFFCSFLTLQIKPSQTFFSL